MSHAEPYKNLTPAESARMDQTLAKIEDTIVEMVSFEMTYHKTHHCPTPGCIHPATAELVGKMDQDTAQSMFVATMRLLMEAWHAQLQAMKGGEQDGQEQDPESGGEGQGEGR